MQYQVHSSPIFDIREDKFETYYAWISHTARCNAYCKDCGWSGTRNARFMINKMQIVTVDKATKAIEGHSCAKNCSKCKEASVVYISYPKIRS